MATPIQSCFAWSIGSKKSEEPHVEQKPRRTFSEERNQVTLSAPWIVKAERGTSVLARKCPDHFSAVHCEQWQASGGAEGRQPRSARLRKGTLPRA